MSMEQIETTDSGKICSEFKAKILRRREEALTHPERLEPWEGTADRLREKLHEIRRKKTQAAKK